MLMLVALLEGVVEIDLADFAAQRGLASWVMAKHDSSRCRRRRARVENLHVEDAVDAHLDVVARDADLLGDIDGGFFERVPVADDVHERREDMKAGLQRAGVAAQALDDVGALLRHDHGRLGENDDREKDQNDNDNNAFGQ